MSTILATRATVRQLRADVEAICFPRGRMVGSPGHRKARKVLCARLDEIGCVPYRGDSFELPYQRKGQSFCNLIGVIPGSNPRLAPLLVGAHYDSAIAAPCADDNAIPSRTLSSNLSKVSPHEGAELLDSLSVTGRTHEPDP